MQLHDPYRDELVRELRMFRKSEGEPGSNRMAGLFYLTSMLGDGIPERAFEELMQLRKAYGTDPLTPIGAFFFLSGWEVGLGTVDERRKLYVERHLAGDISTPLRRSNRGIRELCELIRDRDESYRPWAFVSIFQSGNTFQPVLDFNFAHESWAYPSAFLNDDEIDLNFHVHKRPDKGEGYTRRFVLPETPLDIAVGFAEVMARVRVTWPMPVWPVWSLQSWTADPRILTHMRTFRSRSVEVTLQWWRVTPADQLEGLVRDGAIWTERTDPSRMNLPDSWKRT